MDINPPPTLAYLNSCYPAFSHTFILREVVGLKAQGFNIQVASINESDIPEEKMSPIDHEEAQSTFYVKKQGAWRAFKTAFKLMFTSPKAFFSTLFFAVKWGGWDLRKQLYHLFYFAEAILIGNWMAKSNLKHLHVHFGNPASTVAVFVHRLFSFTFSISVHGPDEFYDVTLMGLSTKIREASFIFCIGYYAKSQLMRLSAPNEWYKIHVVPLGVDLNLYAPSNQKKDKSPLTFISVGRLTPSKGQFILLEAFQLLCKQRTDAVLHIVGDGPDRESLQKEAEALGINERVIFHGALNQEQTWKKMQLADVFVLASFAEGIPVALMEAMAQEISCISTEINGIPELIQNGVNGLLVIPANPVTLAAAMQRLGENGSLRQSLGQAGRRHVYEKYNLEKNIKLLAEEFKECLNKLR